MRDDFRRDLAALRDAGQPPLRVADAGDSEHQTLIGSVTTTAAPGTLVLSVTPTARFAALGNPIKVLNADTSATRQQGEEVFAVLGTTAVNVAGEPIRWVERLGGEATGQLHFVGRLDAQLASGDLNGFLTGAESDFGYVGGVLPDPLPTTVGNPHGEAGEAGDRALCFPNPVPSWVAGTDYSTDDRVRAIQPGSSPSAWHEYQAPADLTSGAAFNTAEESQWTDRGETTGEPWVIVGVFNAGGEASGTQGKVAYLIEDLQAAREIAYADLTQDEKDALPAGARAEYESEGGTVLMPQRAVGELVTTVVTDALLGQELYVRSFAGDLDVINTVKQSVSGGQYIQIKAYTPGAGGSRATGILDVAQCSSTGGS